MSCALHAFISIFVFSRLALCLVLLGFLVSYLATRDSILISDDAGEAAEDQVVGRGRHFLWPHPQPARWAGWRCRVPVCPGCVMEQVHRLEYWEGGSTGTPLGRSGKVVVRLYRSEGVHFIKSVQCRGGIYICKFSANFPHEPAIQGKISSGHLTNVSQGHLGAVFCWFVASLPKLPIFTNFGKFWFFGVFPQFPPGIIFVILEFFTQ